MSLPIIIQGGMGVAVSNWKLARTVSKLGQLGVVSGALIAVVFARRLQAGDTDGAMRRAMNHFPFPEVAQRIVEQYFVPEGKPVEAPFKLSAMPSIHPSAAVADLMVAASFAEVFLAKEGHDGQVGINLLEKIQVSTLPTLYGAMLADVDFILMGAGIPRTIPGALDLFAKGSEAQLRIDVENAPQGEEHISRFDPHRYTGETPRTLKRPDFLAIVSSATLATSLARKSNGKVNGFVIEADIAGGHNAPPRGALQLTPDGEPIYGPRDVADLAAFRTLGLPFWLAGGQAHPAKLKAALAEGAVGIQVGSAFAFCEESGLSDKVKKEGIRQAREGSIKVFTDPLASPTGFPFKVMQIEGTLSAADVYAKRERICDLGYLRVAYKKDDGGIGYRCPAEPIEDYVAKGGAIEETVGRKCLCNGLITGVGLGQKRPEDGDEDIIVTVGNDIDQVLRYLPPGANSYTAADVIKYLQGNA